MAVSNAPTNDTGQLTPEWSRFLMIPRHAFRDVFKSKLFTAFFRALVSLRFWSKRF